MNLFINDLSLDQTFHSFDAAIHALLELRGALSRTRVPVYVTRHLLLRPATPGGTLFEAISQGSPTQRALLLAWLSKSGPFSEDHNIETHEDLWFFEQDEVTEQGLGFAGRFQLSGARAAAFSFTSPNSQRFERDSLDVVQGLPGEPIGIQPIDNFWSEAVLINWTEDLAELPKSWRDFVESSVASYPHLRINADVFLDALGKHPFHQNVVARGTALLSVLENIAAGIQPDGSLNAGSMALLTEHFQSKKAWFSDETPDDRNVFMFRDHTSINNERIYCSWHGKVKTPQFRMHFEWPVPIGQDFIKVLYFGEKLTKN